MHVKLGFTTSHKNTYSHDRARNIMKDKIDLLEFLTHLSGYFHIERLINLVRNGLLLPSLAHGRLDPTGIGPCASNILKIRPTCDQC
jgi:hypothetical protein